MSPRSRFVIVAAAMLPACAGEPLAPPADRVGLPQASAATGAAAPVINEFVANHVGADTHEFVEIFGAPSTDHSAYTILQIEGDGAGAGVIDAALPVGTTDANGFWTTGFLGDVLENGTLTLLLVTGFTGSVGQDLDGDDDGVLDAAPWSGVADAVAVHDGAAGDRTYGVPALGPGFDGVGFAPGGASRIPNGTDTDAADDWVRNDFDGEGLPGFSGTLIATEALNTPNATNTKPAIPPAPVLNEFVANHVGTDTHEFVEIFGEPDTDYSAFTVLQIEGDGSGAGVIDAAFPIGTTDANGFWTTGFLSDVLENGTMTLLVVVGFAGSVGQDLDSDDDGALDATPWFGVGDAVAVHDGAAGDRTYLATVLDANFDGLGLVPGGASRIPNGEDTGTPSDWTRNDFDGAGLPGFTGAVDLGEALNTPGAPNALSIFQVDLSLSPGTINCTNGNGVLVVSALSTAAFDATLIDHASVRFAGAAETHVHPGDGTPRRHEEDVDGDGDADLLFHFRLADTDLDCGSTSGQLTGQTFNGAPIAGSVALDVISP